MLSLDGCDINIVNNKSSLNLSHLIDLGMIVEIKEFELMI